MIISVINHASAQITDAELQRVLRALNLQIECDFAPYWSLGATLGLEGKSGKQPSKQSLADMRGDAVLYLWDKADVDDALGYHDMNNRGIPFGVVFTALSKAMGEHWSITLSHEALELIGDLEINLLVMGPHPKHLGRDVFHWYEMCDAVQDESYEIDGVQVSNFVLPLYFTGVDEKGGRNDFLGQSRGGTTLTSFGLHPGGYVGFFDPEKQDIDTVDADERGAQRRLVKSRGRGARRGIRYGRFHMTSTSLKRGHRAARQLTGAEGDSRASTEKKRDSATERGTGGACRGRESTHIPRRRKGTARCGRPPEGPR